MAVKHRLQNHFTELRVFHNRSLIALFMTLLLFGILIVRLFYLQIVSHEHFTTLSQNNRVSVQAIPPTRGLIYDSNGIILAENLPSYTLEIIPEQTEDMEKTLRDISQLINIREIDRQKFAKEVKRKRRFEGVPLRFRLSDKEVAIISVNLHRLHGVKIKAQLTRHYPFSNETAHVVGYVGRINEKELKILDATNYSGSNHTGKLGIEKSYEALLHGQVGYQEVETNVRGRVLRVLARHNPTPGDDLYLNLDINLQKVVTQAFEDKRGAMVAVDPSNGKVLAMVSMPSYYPNLFVNGIDSKTYNELNTSWERPLYNRTILGSYPPGSTVKPFYALGGLELNIIKDDHQIFCPGFYRLKGKAHKYRDWKKWGHGKTDLTKSIVQSCDVFYYDLAVQMGIDKMHEFMNLFGFGKRSGIDVLGERSGLMPSREWKRKARGQVWFPGETVIAGIGQGYMLVTPLQLALATATLANGGKHYQPQLLHSIKSKADAVSRSVSKQLLHELSINSKHHWDHVYKAMTDVIHSARGTARRLDKPDLRYKIAGKTGTAQVFTVAQDEEYDDDELDERLKDHALFMAVAPADSPKIAVGIVIENGGHGGAVAAPIAGQVIEYYLGRFSDEALHAPLPVNQPSPPAAEQPAAGQAAEAQQAADAGTKPQTQEQDNHG